MACGCNSVITIPSTCNKNATVCQGGHVIIPINCSAPLVSAMLHGVVLIHTVNNDSWLIYQHDGVNTLSDSFTYECGAATCVVTVEVIEGVEEKEKIITLVASGECEVGTPTYFWNIPPCATLVSGYTPYDPEIKLIVNTYDPELTIEEQICIIRVTVCCGECEGCCKCKSFYWQPPICTGDCEEITCSCPYPCTTLNNTTGNCEPICATASSYCMEKLSTNSVNSGSCDSGSRKNKFFVKSPSLPGTRVYYSWNGIDPAGNIQISNFTEVTTTDTIVLSVESGIYTINVAAENNATYGKVLSFSEEYCHLNNALNYIRLLNNLYVMIEAETPCGIVRDVTKLVFNPDFSLPVTNPGLNNTFINNNQNCRNCNEICCSVLDCLTIDTVSATYVEGSTGIDFSFLASISGGIWSGTLIDTINVSTCYNGTFIPLVEDISTIISDNSLVIAINGFVNPGTGVISTPYTLFLKYEVSGSSKVIVIKILPGTLTPGSVIGSLFVTTSYQYNNLEYCGNSCSAVSFLCAQCCENNQCTVAGCLVSPTCEGGDCKCYVNGQWVDPLPNGCCPECIANVGCQECINNVLFPVPTCAINETLNLNTCECECLCTQGLCIDYLEPNPTLRCKPCPTTCTSVPNQWSCNEVPFNLACENCFQCIDNVCVENPCSDGYYASDNDCCTVCPACFKELSVTEHCPIIHIPKFIGCDVTDTYYQFKWYSVIALGNEGCTYQDIISNPGNLVDITNQIGNNLTVTWNATASVFFEPTNTADAYVSGGFLKIKKIPSLPFPATLITQSLILEGVYFGIDTLFEFKFDITNCTLATILSSNLVTEINPRLFRNSCAQALKLITPCDFTEVGLIHNCAVSPVIYNDYYLFINSATSCVAAFTAKNILGTTICYEKTVNHIIDPCDGGCGCAPCVSPTDGFIINIETQNVGSQIFASSSVLVNCGDTLSGLLATCEPAASTEVCPVVNHCGSSPLAVNGNYNCASCGTFNCLNACTTNICGWAYQEDSFSLVGYNGNNIVIEFLPGILNGKICYGVNTECGYVCNCNIIDRPCIAPDFTTLLGCTSVNNLSQTSNITIQTSTNCTTESTVTVTINTFLGATVVTGVIESVSNSVVITLPEIGINNITSMIVEVCCGDCCTTNPVELTCFIPDYKECELLPDKPVNLMILFDASGSQDSAFAAQKIFIKNIIDLFIAGQSKVGVVVYASQIVNAISINANSNAAMLKALIDGASIGTMTNYDCPLTYANQELSLVGNANTKHILMVTDGKATLLRSCAQCNLFNASFITNCGSFAQSPLGNGLNVNITSGAEIVAVAYNANQSGIDHLLNLADRVYYSNQAAIYSWAPIFYNSFFIDPLSTCVSTNNVNFPLTCNCIKPETSYSCVNNVCVEDINGTYPSLNLCEASCSNSCEIILSNPIINSIVAPSPNKYELVCLNQVSSCVQNNALVTGYSTNSQCNDLIPINCVPVIGGEDCQYYEENVTREPSLSFTIFNFIKEAITQARLTGIQKHVILTYSYKTEALKNLNQIVTNPVATLNQVKAEMQDGLNQIAQLFTCLFPEITMEIVNKNGGYAEETFGNGATYGNIRIGAKAGNNWWGLCTDRNPGLNNITIVGDTYSSTTVKRDVDLNATNACYRLNNTPNPNASSCRSIIDVFIHEVGHALGFQHSQFGGNCVNVNCVDANGCSSVGDGCCNPTTEVLCGCGSAACEQWTGWFDSPYFVKSVYVQYKPNSLDALTPVNTYLKAYICN